MANAVITENTPVKIVGDTVDRICKVVRVEGDWITLSIPGYNGYYQYLRSSLVLVVA